MLPTMVERRPAIPFLPAPLGATASHRETRDQTLEAMDRYNIVKGS